MCFSFFLLGVIDGLRLAQDVDLDLAGIGQLVLDLLGNVAGQENHLILANVQDSFGIDGKFYEVALDMVGLTMNCNAIPNDKNKAFRPSGIRLGTPAVTTRGLGKAEMVQIANWMRRVMDICVKAGSQEKLSEYHAELDPIREEVKELALRFPVPGIA